MCLKDWRWQQQRFDPIYLYPAELKLKLKCFLFVGGKNKKLKLAVKVGHFLQRGAVSWTYLLWVWGIWPSFLSLQPAQLQSRGSSMKPREQLCQLDSTSSSVFFSSHHAPPPSPLKGAAAPGGHQECSRCASVCRTSLWARMARWH